MIINLTDETDSTRGVKLGALAKASLVNEPYYHRGGGIKVLMINLRNKNPLPTLLKKGGLTFLIKGEIRKRKIVREILPRRLINRNRNPKKKTSKKKGGEDYNQNKKGQAFKASSWN